MSSTLPPGAPSTGGAAEAGTSRTKKRGRGQQRHNIGLENSGIIREETMSSHDQSRDSVSQNSSSEYSSATSEYSPSEYSPFEGSQSEDSSLPEQGELIAPPAGGTFTPRIIIVNAGEDIAMEIMLLSVQRLHAVSVLSATGNLSSVTLRDSASGGTVTHEGDFSILTLSGTLEPRSGEPRMRMGLLNIFLARPDGSVFSGVVAGQLIAANRVQVIVGTFMP